MHALRIIGGCFLTFVLFLGAGATAAAPPPTDPVAIDASALEAATADACHMQVVVLGEVRTHGDGHAIAFKAALVHHLVAQCGFKAVLWESSFYEFDHLDRLIASGTRVNRDQVAAAIGGIWNTDTAVQPLIDELTRRANRHELMLGGIDNIWDMAGIPYTTDSLPAALAGRLAPAEATTCAGAFHDRIYNGNSTDNPRDAVNHQQLMNCLGEIRATIPAADRRDRDVLDGLQRYIGDDLQPLAVKRAGLEHAMYLDLRVLIDRLPLGSKVVVWTATVHGARDTGAGIKPMGGYIKDEFGDGSLIVAVGAAGGSYGQAFSDKIYPIVAPASDSVEARALMGLEAPAVYVPAARLKSFGTAPGGLFSHSPVVTRDWSTTVDSAVILRDEYPASRVAAATGP